MYIINRMFFLILKLTHELRIFEQIDFTHITLLPVKTSGSQGYVIINIIIDKSSAILKI